MRPSRLSSETSGPGPRFAETEAGRESIFWGGATRSVREHSGDKQLHIAGQHAVSEVGRGAARPELVGSPADAGLQRRGDDALASAVQLSEAAIRRPSGKIGSELHHCVEQLGRDELEGSHEQHGNELVVGC